MSFGTRHGSLGMTETLASYTFVTRDQQESTPLPDGRTGSMGLAIDGAEIRIVDPDTRDSPTTTKARSSCAATS